MPLWHSAEAEGLAVIIEPNFGTWMLFAWHEFYEVQIFDVKECDYVEVYCMYMQLCGHYGGCQAEVHKIVT